MSATRTSSSSYPTLPSIRVFYPAFDLPLQAQIPIVNAVGVEVLSQQSINHQNIHTPSAAEVNIRPRNGSAPSIPVPRVQILPINKNHKVPQRRGRGRKRKNANHPPCLKCNKTDEMTSQWRKGPQGLSTLCNACGLEYRKQIIRAELWKADSENWSKHYWSYSSPSKNMPNK